MPFPGGISLFAGLVVTGRMLVRVATVFFGLAMLVWVADRCGPSDAEVVVHVMEPDVVVSIGSQTFTIEGHRSEPIVCSVSPGSYALIMRRADQILYEQALEVGPGENVVCTAWVEERAREPRASMAQVEPARRGASPASKAPSRGRAAATNRLRPDLTQRAASRQAR
jgi:hypothetical protein